MATNNLIIVESPAKVKTIKKYLGNNYTIDASMGHLRDLPKSRLGIDLDNDFEPDYITIRGKGELLAKLRKEAKSADKIYLATDPDREGEAISWHLTHALKLPEDKKVYRISFNEISKKAIKESLKNPRNIDMNLVDAQQARRALDRIVGYKISPILWDKIKHGLSAGRVQSVALRMVCDREAEIEAFVPEEYWTLDAELLRNKSKKPIEAKFYGTEDGKVDIHSEIEASKILKELENAEYKVTEVKKTQRIRKAPLAFTTSALQQDAGRLLNFATSKTMRIAQELYEGVHIQGMGNIALITYLRTDSTRVSDDADKAAKEFVTASYGEEYTATSVSSATNKSGSNVQDAHEAIRPIDINITPASIKDSVSADIYKLYNLIWKRFTASRMKPAIFDQMTARISAGKYIFNVSGSRLAFDGFLKVYNSADDKPDSVYISDIEEGDILKLADIKSNQHFTQAPPHFTEASLVKALEEQGIGRPSTYAPTISTILARRYITKEQKNLYVTELGQVVNNMMVKEFPSIVDIKFTANMEQQLDDVAEGRLEWKQILREFYPDFEKELNNAQKELESVTIADEVTDVVCDLCGRNMVIKYGPHGKFLACPGFPECRNTKPYLEKIGVKCPKCGGDVLKLKTKKGRVFYGCSNNPECDYASWNKPTIKQLDK